MGIPNYGYNWTLPYVKGSRAQSLGNVEAVELARMTGSTIQYDETDGAPYFEYTDPSGSEHIVWFEDARSIKEKIDLITEYGFIGTSYWNIMKFFPQNWLVVNALYNIYKAL